MRTTRRTTDGACCWGLIDGLVNHEDPHLPLSLTLCQRAKCLSVPFLLRLLSTQEIRRTGFRDIDDRMIVCPMSQQRSNKRWTLKRDPASFSWRGARELSEDGMTTDATSTSQDTASSTCRPLTKRRQCQSSLQGAEMPRGQEQQQQQERQEQQRGARVARSGKIFGGLPRWSRVKSVKKGASLPSSTMTSPTPSTRGVRYSATHRAISWR